MLVYLAATGVPQARAKLTGLFWGEWPEAQARHYLSRALWDIGKRIPAHPPVLVSTPQTIAFNKQCAYSLDVEEFEQQVDKETGKQVNRYSEERDLSTCVPVYLSPFPYRGDFLDGFFLRDCPEFELWMVAERARLHELAIETLARVIAVAAAQGRAGHAIGVAHARRLLELEPLREETQRALMSFLARSGQRSAALAQYAQCRALLAAELGVEPPAETTRLYERIRAADAMPAPNLPPQPTEFVGRAEELAQVARLLANPACRLLTLIGPGGIGKTRLAVQVAQENVGAFLHGVYFVPLASVRAADLLVPTIAAAMQFSFSSQQDPKAQLLNYLREKEILLVPDNLEHLPNNVGLLAEMLQSAPALKILVTSRARLNSQWEWLVEVEGLEYPIADGGRQTADRTAVSGQSSAVSEAYSAVQLFAQTARRVQPCFSLSDVAPSVARICQLVEGMPLALEMAAAWTREMPCQEIAQGLERGLDFLQTSQRDVSDRHRSMRAVFDHSWNLLTDEERRVFSRLSVFHGWFSVDAAQAVLDFGFSISDSGSVPVKGESKIEDRRSKIRNALSALVDKSLLRRNPSGRCELHELLRQYAAEKLATTGEEQDTRDRHCAYYAEFLERRESALKGAKQKQVSEEIVGEIDNVRAGWQWAVERGNVLEIARGLEGLFLFYEMRSHFQEGAEAFGQAVQKLRALNQDDEMSVELLAKALARQGWWSVRLGAYEQARALLRESLGIAQPRNMQAETAFAISGLGRVSFDLDEYADASKCFEQSLAIYEAIGNQSGRAMSLNGLGLVAQAQDPTRALDLLKDSIAIFQKIGDQRAMMIPSYNLGETLMRMGKYAQAQQRLREALVICRTVDDPWYAAAITLDLGTVAWAMGEYAESRNLCEKSLQVFRAIGAVRGLGFALGNLGRAAEGLGDLTEAKRQYEASLEIFGEIGFRTGYAWSLPNLARAVLWQGDETNARVLYQEGIGINHQVSDPWIRASFLNGLGQVACALGARTESRQHFCDALKTALKIQSHSLALDSWIGLAMLLAGEGEKENAVELAERVLAHPAENLSRRTKVI